MVVWTKEAEKHWQATHAKPRWHERKAGEQAIFDGVPVMKSIDRDSIYASFVERKWVVDDGEPTSDSERKFYKQDNQYVRRWLSIQKLREEQMSYSAIANIFNIGVASLTNWIKHNSEKFAPVFGEIK